MARGPTTSLSLNGSGPPMPRLPQPLGLRWLTLPPAPRRHFYFFFWNCLFGYAAH